MRSAPKWTDFPRYPVIAGTALLSVAVSLAWWAKVDISPLFESALIRRGELWRLMTSIFPHASVLHLAFNVYWLWIFGTLIEQVYGHLRIAALIILFALGSGTFEFAFSLGGVGLSGVGYGLFSLLWVLSRHDDRFRDAVDEKTIRLFIVWFFFCIVADALHLFSVGNIAHGAGAVFGMLTGLAIVSPRRRLLIVASIGAIVALGLWGCTLGRPRINVSGKAGYEEAKWGYDDLVANRNADAFRWLGDAVLYQPKESIYWYNFGIACQRLNRQAQAKSAYQRAHQLQPDKAEYAEALRQFD